MMVCTGERERSLKKKTLLVNPNFSSLKWYKDNQEFFSYIPRLTKSPKRLFQVKGVKVDVRTFSLSLFFGPKRDMFIFLFFSWLTFSSCFFKASKTDHQHLFLKNVTRETAGEYKCQVSGEGPLFATEAQSKQLRVAGELHIQYLLKKKAQKNQYLCSITNFSQNIYVFNR